jgi:predicted lipid-binding transport protein (Tim44 family)
MNTAQYGLGSAPSFITPQTGLGYISAENAAKASMYGAEQQAAAARSAGKKSMLGGLLGGALGMFDINIGG